MKIIITLAELRQLMETTNCTIYVEESLPEAPDEVRKPRLSSRKKKAAAPRAKKEDSVKRRHKGRCRKDGTCCMTPTERRAYRKQKIIEKYNASSMVDPQRDAEYMKKVHA